MNAKYLIAAIAALAVSGSALAQEYVAPDANFVSTKTRAEVAAELQQARADGSLNDSEYNYPNIQVASSKTRAEVLAELDRARSAGQLDVSEHNYPVLQAAGNQKTRDQVRAELAQYREAKPYGDLYHSYVGH